MQNNQKDLKRSRKEKYNKIQNDLRDTKYLK